jgi:hypothetical protein
LHHGSRELVTDLEFGLSDSSRDIAGMSGARSEHPLGGHTMFGGGRFSSQQEVDFHQQQEASSMRSIRWIAVVPFLALIVGPFFVNRATPLILGLPFLLAWIVAWVLLTSLIMAVIYATDQANREDEP